MDAADRTQLAALAAQVTELSAEVERLRHQRMGTMAQTFRCPGCGGARILHFKRIQELRESQLVDLALQKSVSMWTGVTANGSLEAYACRSCRLVEWRASELASVVVDNDKVIEYDSTEPAVPAPYR